MGNYMILKDRDSLSLEHSGVLKQRWGVRRYQNYDGSLTPLGREHYGVGPPRGMSEEQKKSYDIAYNQANAKINVQLKDAGKALRQGTKAVATKLSSDFKAYRESKEKEKEQAAERKREEQARAEEEQRKKEEEEKRIAEELAAEQERVRIDEMKDYIRKHPGKIYENRNSIPREEMDKIMRDIEWDRKVKDFQKKEYERYISNAKTVVDALDTAYKGADNLKKLYNIGAETYNALIAARDPNDDKKPIHTIGNDKFTVKKKSNNGDNNNNNNNNSSNNDGNNNSNNKESNNSDKGNTKNKKAKDTSSSDTKQADGLRKTFEDLSKAASKASKKNNSTSENPKYVDKIGDRYFYSKEEVKAYKANKDLADKAAKAYSKASSSERTQFISDLWDIYDEKISSMSTADKQKYNAVLDAILKNTKE